MPGRKVQSAEGSKYYNLPIGATIAPDGSPAAREPEEVTVVRLKSLQRQIIAAVKTGDKSEMRRLKQIFSSELQDYAGGKPASDVIRDLQGSLVRDKPKKE